MKTSEKRKQHHTNYKKTSEKKKWHHEKRTSQCKTEEGNEAEEKVARLKRRQRG